MLWLRFSLKAFLGRRNNIASLFYLTGLPEAGLKIFHSPSITRKEKGMEILWNVPIGQVPAVQWKE